MFGQGYILRLGLCLGPVCVGGTAQSIYAKLGLGASQLEL